MHPYLPDTIFHLLESIEKRAYLPGKVIFCIHEFIIAEKEGRTRNEEFLSED